MNRFGNRCFVLAGATLMAIALVIHGSPAAVVQAYHGGHL